MDAIDFRSDTVTQPTPAMREAMLNAAVGDDVYGDDPTVNQLQADAAAMFGMEAGLFVVSGTMGNLTATLTHCTRGDEMIVGKQSHIVMYEVGSHSAYGGIHPFMLDVRKDGTLDLDEIRAAVRATTNPHFPRTRLICLENTQGGTKGAPVPADYIRQVVEIAREHDLKVHIDGARIFNAAAALGTTVRELTAGVDSVTFCLSKGLCAPVGSVLVGSHEFIERAHRVRKSLGGGLRQVGVLAAPGLIALHQMSTRLSEDHANARLLAESLAKLPYIQIDLATVQTNMVFFSLTEDAPLDVQTLSARLKADYNILMRPYDPRSRSFRAVTHYYITRERVLHTVEAIGALLGVREGVAQ